MIPIKPNIEVPGDNDSKTMWDNGYVVGFNKKNAIWSFGFTADSERAKLYNLSITGGLLLWVLADFTGKVESTCNGKVTNLPNKKMAKVLTDKIGDDDHDHECHHHHHH